MVSWKNNFNKQKHNCKNLRLDFERGKKGRIRKYLKKN